MKKEIYVAPISEVVEFPECETIITASQPTVEGPGDRVDLPDDLD